jgi:hypothetical protein
LGTIQKPSNAWRLLVLFGMKLGLPSGQATCHSMSAFDLVYLRS